MFKTVAELGVPYVLTASSIPSKGGEKQSLDEVNLPAASPFTPPLEGMGEAALLLRDLGSKVEVLHELGVCDIILDPGFGFGKTLEQNYIVMRNLEVLHELELPLLVGVSHKSMIYKLLGTTPDEALNGSTVLHTIALLKGAHILRAHEVKEAMECIRIVEKLKS